MWQRPRTWVILIACLAMLVVQTPSSAETDTERPVVVSGSGSFSPSVEPGGTISVSFYATDDIAVSSADIFIFRNTETLIGTGAKLASGNSKDGKYSGS